VTFTFDLKPKKRYATHHLVNVIICVKGHKNLIIVTWFI